MLMITSELQILVAILRASFDERGRKAEMPASGFMTGPAMGPALTKQLLKCTWNSKVPNILAHIPLLSGIKAIIFGTLEV